MHEVVAHRGALRIAAGADGLITVTGEGFWQDAGVQEHFAQLRLVVERARRLNGAVRGLIDLTRSAVQRPSLIEDIRSNAHQVWRPSDLVAIAAPAALLRLQMNRVAQFSSFRIFATIDDARAWLDGRAGEGEFRLSA